MTASAGADHRRWDVQHIPDSGPPEGSRQQSASDTFTGDRGTLNSEFQTLLGEIDRQASSIGLNTNGQFQQLLPVCVADGRAGPALRSTSI